MDQVATYTVLHDGRLSSHQKIDLPEADNLHLAALFEAFWTAPKGDVPLPTKMPMVFSIGGNPLEGPAGVSYERPESGLPGSLKSRPLVYYIVLFGDAPEAETEALRMIRPPNTTPGQHKAITDKIVAGVTERPCIVSWLLSVRTGEEAWESGGIARFTYAALKQVRDTVEEEEEEEEEQHPPS